jgi:hypothetical protein
MEEDASLVLVKLSNKLIRAYRTWIIFRTFLLVVTLISTVN